MCQMIIPSRDKQNFTPEALDFCFIVFRIINVLQHETYS